MPSAAKAGKHPPRSIWAGRCGVMRATSAAVTWRLLVAKTKPTASAPRVAASCASARFVLPQILIHMAYGFLKFRGVFAVEEKSEGGGGVGLAHERLANQEGVVAD